MNDILDNLKKYSKSYKNIDWRKKQLTKLLNLINANYQNIVKALNQDLGKCKVEASFEIENVIRELKYTIDNLSYWMEDKKISTELLLQFAKSSIVYQPHGLVLIISPFNYPFSLTLVPLIGAISAGNSVVIKPSEYTMNISNLLEQMINDNLDQNNIKIINGGLETSKELLEYQWDYVFFTGSTAVGRIIAKKMAEKFIPYTLELGGKNSVLIDPKIENLDLVAKKIIWAKLLNCGQTCMAPDIIISTPTILIKIKDYMIKYINEFYTKNPKKSRDYGRIVNHKHFDRIIGLLEQTNGTELYKGSSNKDDKYIEPRIIEIKEETDILLKEEIFGPIIVLKSIKNIDEGIILINDLPQALNLYLFSNNKEIQEKFNKETKSGNLVINDLIINFMNHNLPFGGIKESGVGKYGGKNSFITFSNSKSVMIKYHHKLNDIKFRYPPYTSTKRNLFIISSRISLFLEKYNFIFKILLVFIIIGLLLVLKNKICL
jgi:aldehyde dehydrogenase (NAD+)